MKWDILVLGYKSEYIHGEEMKAPSNLQVLKLCAKGEYL